MRKIALGIIALLLMVSVLIAGCTSSVVSNEDQSAYFNNIITENRPFPVSVVSPMIKAKDNVYTGTYDVNGSVVTYTIETAQSESTAKERYGQIVLEKQNAGYVAYDPTEHNTIKALSVFGDVKALWAGSKTNGPASVSVYRVENTYNTDIKAWVIDVALYSTAGVARSWIA